MKQRFVPAFNIVVKVMRHKGHYPNASVDGIEFWLGCRLVEGASIVR